MLRINNLSMDLDLSVLGYVRTGRIFCVTCGNTHSVAQDVRRHEADVLTGRQGEGQVCDCCGTPLEAVRAQVAA